MLTSCATYAATSSECELVQARIQTQYYIQYSIDFLWIIFFVALIVKTLTYSNWLSTMMKKIFR